MNKVYGDLIGMAEHGDFDVIVHGCNCFCTMGAGIAKQIKQHFPEAYDSDCRFSCKGDKKKLGYFSYAIHKNITIVNAYTQYNYSGKNNADYKAIRSVFRNIKSKFHGKRIGYPLIGAGLAGGDWSIISKIIDEELEGENHTLVIYKK